jgi:hypothetical protein
MIIQADSGRLGRCCPTLAERSLGLVASLKIDDLYVIDDGVLPRTVIAERATTAQTRLRRRPPLCLPGELRRGHVHRSSHFDDRHRCRAASRPLLGMAANAARASL